MYRRLPAGKGRVDPKGVVEAQMPARRRRYDFFSRPLRAQRKKMTNGSSLSGLLTSICHCSFAICHWSFDYPCLRGEAALVFMSEDKEFRGPFLPEGMTVTPLEKAPPPSKWNDWVEYDARAWPRRVEKRYAVVPTICFNCEAACG